MLKFLSLIPSFLCVKAPPPIFDVTQYLSSTHIAPPLNAITGGYIPYLELRRIFFIHADKKGDCPLRSSWKNALQETSSVESVSFQKIKGCVCSKSGLTDFELMRHHPKSSSNVNFHIKAYANRVDDLAEKVLNGTMDCAVYKNLFMIF